MPFFDVLFDGVDAGVVALFTIPNIALWIATALLAWCAWIVAGNARRHYLPFSRALDARLDALSAVAEAEDGAEARTAFAAGFPQIDAALAARGPGAAALRHAWLQYRDTLIDLDSDPIAATARPEGWFLHLGDETRILAWWANIFVAVGLTFTFLGIVAALLKAVQAMGASADPTTMQSALIALLHITAAKFWTSIGGVLSSIILRVVDRSWHARTARRLDRLCDRLEAGTVLILPHRVAAEQLAELRRHSALIADMPRPGSSGSGADIGGALAGLADGLAAANRRIEGASEGAGAQIADAAHQFARATERLTATLETLDVRVGGMAEAIGTRAAENVEAAVRRSTAATDDQAATLTAASDEVKTLLGALARVVGEMSGVFAPVRSATLSIERAVSATQDMIGAAASRAERSDRALQATAQGVDLASQAATRAWETYRDRFDAVDTALGEALRQIHVASTDHAAALTAQTTRVDAALAQAVDRLAGALEVIGDLVATLDDLRGEMRAKR
jgi:hypothetical protein